MFNSTSMVRLKCTTWTESLVWHMMTLIYGIHKHVIVTMEKQSVLLSDTENEFDVCDMKCLKRVQLRRLVPMNNVIMTFKIQHERANELIFFVLFLFNAINTTIKHSNENKPNEGWTKNEIVEFVH